jgi:flagellar L-ring protein precursor FlgH
LIGKSLRGGACADKAISRFFGEYKKLAFLQIPEIASHSLAMTIMMLLLSSCSNTIDKLSRVGKAPEFAKIELPAMDVAPQDETKKHTQTEVTQRYAQRVNSLWSPGSNNFFRNKHNWRVGDVIMVKVAITDSAKIDNSTQHSRKGAETVGIPNLMGLENTIAQAVSDKGDATSLIKTNNQHQHQGSGNISRKEDVRTEISALVTQIFPNGNLLIQGRQEVRVNNELREVTVAGIIRPKDISDANTIKSEQMAEARISYGGRGSVSDVQEPRIGNQVLDILSPF